MKRRIRTSLFVLTLAGTLAGCGDDPIGPRTPEDVEFAAELGVDLDAMTKLPSGVYVQTLQAGLGSRTVLETDEIVVDYTLWLPNGTEIDRGEGAEFEVSGVIPGFRDGILGMVEGEVRLIVVPSELGYGNRRQGAIPPNSVLVFRVELLDIPTSG